MMYPDHATGDLLARHLRSIGFDCLSSPLLEHWAFLVVVEQDPGLVSREAWLKSKPHILFHYTRVLWQMPIFKWSLDGAV